MKNENIIIFSSDDWSSGLKSSKYHISIRLSKTNRVLFVNSTGLRNPVVNKNDFKRIFAKVREFMEGARKVNDNLFVCTPLVIPFQSLSFVRKLNACLLLWYIKLLIVFLRFSKPIVFVFIPNVSSVIGKLNEKSIVYYCIDELKGYREVNSELFQKMEEDLLKKANCVITCSNKLFELKRIHNPHTYYIPHGVDWALFRTSLDANTRIPEDMVAIKKPIIGYYGFISDDWIDFELLNYMGKKHLEWSIILIGRTKSDLVREIKTPNIHFLGVRKFEELPQYNKAFDVAIIPFKINELTMSSNPLKMLEYLASGKPVVSVNIPEVAYYSDIVRISSTFDEFVKNVEISLCEGNREALIMRSKKMMNETWERRLELISDIINLHLKF